MKEQSYKSVIGKASFAFANHELIYDSEGRISDFRIKEVNSAFEKITGLGTAKLREKLVSSLFPDGDATARDMNSLYKHLSNNSHAESTEFFFRDAKKWYNIQLIREPKGLLSIFLNDVTVLKHLQNELDYSGYLLIENESLTRLSKSLSESEISYRSLFDHTIDAIYVLDSEGVFLDVNPAATKMYGYEREEMIGYTPAKLSAPGMNDMQKTMESIKNALTGTPQRFNWWGLRKNGEIFPKDVVLNNGVYFGKEVVFAMSRDNSELYNTLDALKNSEDKYRSLTEQLPVGVYRTAIDGQIVYANVALVRILGYNSVDEVLSLNVRKLYFDPENRLQQKQTAEMKGGIVLSEFQLQKKNGELIWVRDNTRLIFDSLGNPEYFDGILEDITEEKISQLTLKQNEANLKAIIENTLENIWSVNLNYEIEYVNEVFVNRFRASFGKDLTRGVNIIDALPEGFKSIWKERYDKAFTNGHYIFEDKIDTIQGAVYIEVAMNPIVVDGKVIGVSVYGKDVTEKRLNQIQLQYQSELRKLLVEVSSRLINLPVNEINSAICQSLTMIGEFVGADRAYVFNYDFPNNNSSNTFEWCREGVTPQIHNLQNMDLDIYSDIVEMHKKGEIVKVDDISEVVHPALRKLLVEQDVLSMLTIPLVKDGLCLGFVGFDSVRASHIYNDYEQQLLQVYAQTVVNAFERLEKEKKLVEAKEKAEESDRLKSAFLANMSHEIRTPMSGIIGFLNLLNEPDLSEENKSTYINIVTQSGQRLLDTINDIIEISKIESGVMQVNDSAVNIRELFGFYDGFFRQQADQKGLEYRVINNLPVTIEFVRTDKKKLDSIISNLVKNAIKFTPAGSIIFKCDLENDHLVFSVKDTGIGIPKERLKSIFERFVQADLSTSRPHEGSGLGLSIVKAYIEMMKGTIRVESQSGRGTEFIFSIPFKADNEVKSGKNLLVPEKKNISNTARILIAEDDYASYLFIQKALDGQGFTFLRTTNGEDTIEAVRKDPGIAVVLMDIKMPGMSGLDATRKIREFNKTIPIIAQTAYSLAGDRELAIESGCTDYISKPINRKDLIKLMSKYIGS